METSSSSEVFPSSPVLSQPSSLETSSSGEVFPSSPVLSQPSSLETSNSSEVFPLSPLLSKPSSLETSSSTAVKYFPHHQSYLSPPPGRLIVKYFSLKCCLSRRQRRLVAKHFLYRHQWCLCRRQLLIEYHHRLQCLKRENR